MLQMEVSSQEAKQQRSITISISNKQALTGSESHSSWIKYQKTSKLALPENNDIKLLKFKWWNKMGAEWQQL
jgi:hypothetical protein